MTRSISHEFTWPESESVVLLGHHGMLGSLWEDELQRSVDPSRLVLLDLDTCDMTDREALGNAIPETCAAIINCAAYTDVDGAEEYEELATLVNGHAVGYLAEICADRDAVLVHYSTDYVFDGEASEAYATDTPRDPCNAYGRSKALGEGLIERSGCAHLILRTSWLYAPHGNNFVRTIARLARERDELQIVDDQRGRPTSARQLVRTSLGLMRAGARGIFHTTDSGECTWFEFGRAICERVSPSCRVVPCTSDRYPRPAVRPAYSVLDITKTERILGSIPHWREALGSVLTTMLEEDEASTSGA
ncbi:MAG: dTDP-4-dehydrorhamnose reductase [Planctomycetota bacterium]|jgi:dTDP-4-dehydrorhamnose reductase